LLGRSKTHDDPNERNSSYICQSTCYINNFIQEYIAVPLVKTGNITGIVGTGQIISEAWASLSKTSPEKMKAEYIEKHFSEICMQIFDEAHKIYRKYEAKALDDLSERILGKYPKSTYSTSDAKIMIKDAIKEGTTYEMSLRQSRASRAGRSFELIVGKLLDSIGISNEHVTKEDKESGLRLIDIVVPSRKTAVKDPDKAKFLSLKTSLKDRWKLVVEDQKPNQTTYLLTLLQREKLTKEVAEKIVSAGIFLYVPDEIKNKDFPNKSGIRKLSDLPRYLR